MTKRTTALIGAMSLIAGGTVLILVSLHTPTVGAGQDMSSQAVAADSVPLHPDPPTTGPRIEPAAETTSALGAPTRSDLGNDVIQAPSQARAPERQKVISPTSDGPRPSSVGAELIVSETAEPSLTRTYAWDLAKDDTDGSTDTYHTSGSPATATVGYAISATRDEGTDGDFAVTGEITIENPNDFAVHNAEVADAIDQGGHCWVASATDQTIQLVPVLIVDIEARSSVTVPYACTFSEQPDAGEDSATVTVDPGTNPNLPAFTFHGTEAYDFDHPFVTPVDDSIDVTDSLGGTHHFNGTGTWTYDFTFAGDPAGVCTPHRNTVTIDDIDISALKDVLVCVDADQTAALTPAPSAEAAA